MARELGGAAEPGAGTLMYPANTDNGGIWTVGSHTPSVSGSAKERFKCAGTGVTDSGERRACDAPPGNFKWYLFELVVEGTLNSGQNIILLGFDGGDNLLLSIHQKTDTSTFEVEIGDQDGVFGSYTVHATSSSTYGIGTELVFRAGFDTVGNIAQIYINGSLEMDYSESATPAQLVMRTGIYDIACLDDSPLQDAYWCKMQTWGSDSAADRPDTSPSFSTSLVYDDGAVSEYTKTGGPPSPDEDWNYWSDVDPPDGDTTYLLGGTAVAWKHVSKLAAGGSALVGTMGGVVLHHYMRAATSGKDANSFFIIQDEDGTPNVSENAAGNEGTGAYNGRVSTFGAPPDAGSWDDFLSSGIFNHASSSQKMQAGSRITSPNDVNTHWSGTMLVACAIGDDPPPPPAAGDLPERGPLRGVGRGVLRGVS